MLHPFDYPYERATVLDRSRPYDFSPYLGPGFLHSFWRSRRAFREHLVDEVGRFGAGPAARACQSWLESLRTRLGEEARAPEREVPLRSLAAARSQWQRSVESGACNTTDLLGRILIPCFDGPHPLRGGNDASDWAVESIERLLRRFEARRRVFPLYDGRWRKIESDPSTPGPYAWLAAGGAWLSWSHRDEDLAGSLFHLNATLKLLDLLNARYSSGEWRLTAFEAGLVLMSLEMEACLVEGSFLKKEAVT